MWYPIWDRGLRLDHSVRTVREAVHAAEGDLKVALGLLDARHVAGDRKLTDDLRRRVDGLWRKRAKRWIPQLKAASQERHEHFGEVAYLLEPELKEGRGGIRDVALLRVLAGVTTVLGDLVRPLDQPAANLAAVRGHLHARAGRQLDRLLLQEQDAVADAYGAKDADELLAVVSAAARTISWVWDECWRRVDGWVDPKRRGGLPDRPLGPGLALSDGEIHVHGPARQVWLAAAAAAAELRVPITRAALNRFAEEVPPAPDPWPYGWRQSFVALLGAGTGAIPVLESLDHHGLIVRLLPEWDAVRSRPQRNAYHRFTVDRHLIEAVAQAAAFTRRVSRPDLLLLGALLHDLGKGYPGDHTDAGVEVAARVAPRMGLPPHDVETVVAMVRHHLLLPDTAMRRDVEDPDTAASVARAVGDRETLDLLAALTEADSLATGPAAWSDWKAKLVGRLVENTTAVLEGRRLAEPDVNAMLPPFLEDGLHATEDRCIVVAEDRPGLFSIVAGVLALNGINVLGATAGVSQRGRAVEVFDVEHAFGGSPAWDRVRADLDDALDGRLALQQRLDERVRAYARRDASLAPPPRVIIDNDASSRATVVEVRAPDDVGVLYRITAALAYAGLDIRSARVSTLGHEVVDSFYVVDRDGNKLVDGTATRDVEDAVLDFLRREPE